jgi:hypothetical protein
MNGELASLDLRIAVPSVAVPVLFVLGRYDRVTDPLLAEAYLAQLAAPRKHLVLVRGVRAQRAVRRARSVQRDRVGVLALEEPRPRTEIRQARR